MWKRAFWGISFLGLVLAVSLISVRCGKAADYDASVNTMKF